ncbi:hypothetical protein, partial [Caenispirillum salinarum]|uniref:hypothetical protein n=1 Tax=Caenispirillum salinarum TaxID=859058 RepID=UPI0012670DA2
MVTRLGGAWQTLSCDGALGVTRPFSSPFLRPTGLAADPNLFGLIAVILPGAALALSLRPGAAKPAHTKSDG